MYRIGICDDGKNTCTSIENMVLIYAKQKNIRVDVAIWYTGEGLCEYLGRGEYLDILFLDIELFEMTGVDVANYIRNQLDNRAMQIIYISAKTSYAQQLFKTQPLDFLIKPISLMHITEVLDLALKILCLGNEKFEYQNGREYYYISYSEIMYFTSVGRKIKIVLQHEKREYYGKLRDILEQLPEEFIVIHQSFIVNRNYISCYSYEEIKLIDGTLLAISKSNRKKVREKILQENKLWQI